MDRSLLQIYSIEQREHIERIRELLGALSNPAEAPTVLDELLRRTHTLKGAARAVGLEQTEVMVHAVEDALSRMRKGTLVAEERVQRAIQNAVDGAEDLLAAVIAERNPPDLTEVIAQVAQLGGASAPRVESKPVPKSAPQAESASPVPPSPQADLIRVNPEHIDNLIRSTSQLLVEASSNAATGDLELHANHLDEAAMQWEHQRRRAASLISDGDPETARTLEDCLNYVTHQFGSLRREARSAALSHRGRSDALHRQTSALHQNAYRVRTVAAESVFGGLGPMVRDLARQEGKQVDFRTDGLDLQADRLVLQAFKDPVMHLLRNALSHGIESETERIAAGKPVAGWIHLQIASRGDRVVITVEDDGRGINRKAVMEEARRRGLITERQRAIDPEQAATLIQQPGFSTARMITSLSGRGMGLSSVRQTVGRLGGELTIRPRRQGGTTVAISAPLSIWTQHVVFFSVADQTFGISSAYVERVLRVPPAQLATVNGRPSLILNSTPLPVVRMSDLLGLSDSSGQIRVDEGGMLQAAILHLNEDRQAVLVDRWLDQREVAVKESGLPPSMAGLTSGAVPLEDGGVAVLLNVAELFSRAEDLGLEPLPALIPKPDEVKTSRILVVDDSLTTRSLEKTILEAHGYQVQLAVDGQEALERIRQNPPDLVISDVMMPRMTGFQLLEKLKSSTETKHIPLILVTSLESRQEQEQGLSLGADAYIVKRRFDPKELLEVVRQIL